jgi:hypothetical protein
VGSQLPASPSDIDAKERRSLAVVAAVVITVCFARTAMFTWLSRGASTAIAQVVAAIDRAPEARRVLVVDVPASAALAFPQALRMERPDRPLVVDMLSLLPAVTPSAGELSTVKFSAPDRFEVRRPSGYLDSYIERALEGPPRSYAPGEVVHRDGFDVTFAEGASGPSRLGAFDVTLRAPGETIVLAQGPEGLAVVPPRASP